MRVFILIASVHFNYQLIEFFMRCDLIFIYIAKVSLNILLVAVTEVGATRLNTTTDALGIRTLLCNPRVMVVHVFAVPFSPGRFARGACSCNNGKRIFRAV